MVKHVLVHKNFVYDFGKNGRMVTYKLYISNFDVVNNEMSWIKVETSLEMSLSKCDIVAETEPKQRIHR